MLREIKKEEFVKKIFEKNGDFKNLIFNFEINLFEIIKKNEQYLNNGLNFDIDFKGSVFKQKISFSKVIFKKNFNFSKIKAAQPVDFFNTIFYGDFQSKNSLYNSKANFNMTRFHYDADFSKSNFLGSVHFKKARFYKNLFMGKTYFRDKIDFSYAHFSNDYFTSFNSVNYKKNCQNDCYPYFVFRNIYFPPKTIFNNINLSKTVFQNSIIDEIVFKNCIFPKKGGRNVFYPEIAKNYSIKIKTDLNKISADKINTIILPSNKDLEELNISDILELIPENENEKSEKFFIITKYKAKNYLEMKEILKKNNLKEEFFDFEEAVCHKCFEDKGYCIENNLPVVAFRIKKFDPIKHWEVLEDIYRQMKKSLEDSKDWQGASDFYIGEMESKIKLLKNKNEKFWYRKMLVAYKWISSFGESLKRIITTMFISFLIGTIVLYFLKPEIGFFKIVETNIGFFLPIFGNNTATISSLNLEAWKNVIIQLEIIWFYLLWLILAIAIKRKLQR